MTLHFPRDEFERRQRAAVAALHARGLDGLLVFRQESMYWLTGYDTLGYVMFQVLYLGPDGRFVLLTRSPDLRQARFTSTIDDIRIWVDRGDADPITDLRALLDELGGRGKRIGIESHAWCLNAETWDRLEAGLAGFCELIEATDLIDRLRLVKSEAELAHVRRAATLADQALERAHALARPGAFEGDILASMQGAIFSGDGDYPNGGMVIGSGPGALMVRDYTGRRHLDPSDQLQLELAAVYRHYHCCLMRTVLIGRANDRQKAMHAACGAALAECKNACRPGATMGEVFDAHARTFDAVGFEAQRLAACGYSLGATFSPTWMDFPMFYTGNTERIDENMIFFLHMILLDSERGLTVSLGETVHVQAGGALGLSRLPHDLVVNP